MNNPHRRTVFWVWGTLFLVAMLYLFINLKVESGLQQFLPGEPANAHQQILLEETSRGAGSLLLMVAIKTETPEQAVRISKQLATALRAQKDDIANVYNGIPEIKNNDVDKLMAYRYLLKQPPNMDADALRPVFETRLRELQLGLWTGRTDYLLRDPHLQFVTYLQDISMLPKRLAQQEVWFDRTSNSALLIIKTHARGYDLDMLERVIVQTKTLTKKVAGIDTYELTIAGPGMIAVKTRVAIEQTMKVISIVLLLLVLFVFWFGYRSLLLAVIAGLPLASAIVAAMAVTQLLFGQVHGIVIAFGITLLGVCLDYPLHLFSHMPEKNDAGKTLTHIWPTLITGVLTSVLGYLALIGTGFAGLTQLAVFAATGLLIAILVVRFGLPPLLKNKPLQRHFGFLPPILPVRYKLLLSGVLVVLPLLYLANVEKFWSENLNSISPVSETDKQADQRLRKSLGLPSISDLFLVEADSAEFVLQKAEQLSTRVEQGIKNKIIADQWGPHQLLPSRKRQAKYQAGLPSRKVLEASVQAAVRTLPFKAHAFDTFVDDVVASRSIAPMRYDDFQSTPLGEQLGARLVETNAGWIGIIRIANIEHTDRFTHWVQQSPELTKAHLNMGDATSELMQDYNKRAVKRIMLVLAFFLLVVLWLAHKRAAALWMLVPVFSSLLITVSWLIYSGQTLTIFHVIALLLVLAMGIDYCLFFNRPWESRSSLLGRMHAILISAVTTIAVFTSLAFSEIPLLAIMGETVAIGILVTYIVSMLIAIPHSTEHQAA